MKKILFISFYLMLVVTTTMAQTGWVKQNSGVTTGLGSVHFLNNDTGLCNGGTFILRTTDGGMVWRQVDDDSVFHKNPSHYGINKLFVTNDHSIIAIGYGFIARSTDAGASWMNIKVDSLLPLDDLVDISFPTQDTGYIVGANYYSSTPPSPLLRTTNQGKTWTLERITDIGIWVFRAAQFRTGQLGLGVINSLEPPGTNLVRTTDGGVHWSRTPPFGEEGSFGLVYSKAQTWYLLTNKGFLHSSDDGNTWDSVDNIVSNELGLFDSIPLYRVGSFVIKSIDGGKKWFKQSIDLQGQRLNSVFAVSETIAYAVGTGGAIYKTTDGGGAASSVTEKHSPLLLSEIAITPNPSYGSFSITLPSSNSVGNIEIIDVLGRVVRIIPITRTEPTYRITDLSQGIYYCRYDNVFTKIVVQ